MAAKVSLTSQIAAVQAVAGDGFVTPSNKAQREMQQDHLRAAANTLRWLKANEMAIRALVNERGGKA